MATIETGGAYTSTTGPSRISFSRQQLSYQKLQGDHYDKIRQLVATRFEQAEQYAKSRFERFYRYEKLVNMVTKKKAYDWKANAFLPYAFSASEQSAAIKWLALFMTRPYITVLPRRAGLDDVALRRQSLLDWRLTGDVDVVELGANMLRIAERYGKAIALVAPEWSTKTLQFRDRVELPTAYGPVARMAWKTAEKREYKITVKHLDNTDFFPEPSKMRINGPHGMRWCFRRYYLVMDDLEQMEAGQLIGPTVGGQSVYEIQDTQEEDFNEYKLRRMFLDKYDDVDRYRDKFDKVVELIEYQGAVPKELVDPAVAEMEFKAGRDPYQRLIILANRKTCLEDVSIPWDHGLKSFIELDCVPDPHDFWGKGKVEPIEHMCYVGNEIINMRIDNVKMAINGLIGVHGDRMPSGWKRRLMSQPWGVVETQGPPREVIERLMLGDVTASSYTEQQQIFSLIQEAAAINETLMGAPGPERTLGEHQLKAESASKRLQFELVGQARQLLGFPYGLAGYIISLDRQYLPLPTYMKVVQPDTPDDFMEVSLMPEDLAAEDELFAYLPTGATEGINIQAKRVDLGQMLQALQPFMPMMAMAGFNFQELVKTILKIFGHDPGRYFPKVQGVMGTDAGAMAAGMMNPMAGAMAVQGAAGGKAAGPAGAMSPDAMMQAIGAMYGNRPPNRPA